MITLKYQGQEQSRSKSEASFKETFQGTETEINSQISTLPPISTKVEGKGFLTSWRKTCDEGPIWNLEVEYTISYDSGDFDNNDEQVYGKKSAQLSARNIQMPLEGHPNYLTNWNYYLIGLGNVTTPGWWATATDIMLTPTQRKQFQWVKSIGEIPQEPDQNGDYWTILEEPQKPRS